jgi:tryptophan synthase alpha chain
VNRIEETFSACKARNCAAFVPFIMGGDPSLTACATLLNALPKAGADIIEIGIPFSDPMADGPVIEAAGKRALDAGATVRNILDMVAAFRSQHTTPIVLMGYLNPIHHYGYAAFARDAAAAGVDGIILVDLPPEEAEVIEPVLSQHAIALVRLVAPTSVAARLPLLTKNASGYLYYVSITGITGAATGSATSVSENIAAIRAQTQLPVCVGFGIKTPDDVRAMAAIADGVVVGSALVKRLHESNGDIADVLGMVRALADGCKRH